MSSVWPIAQWNRPKCKRSHELRELQAVKFKKIINRTETPANTTMVIYMSYVVTVESAVKYSFVQKGIEMRRKSQYRAELTLLLVWMPNHW